MVSGASSGADQLPWKWMARSSMVSHAAGFSAAMVNSIGVPVQVRSWLASHFPMARRPSSVAEREL